jgi:hypothetical protein
MLRDLPKASTRTNPAGLTLMVTVTPSRVAKESFFITTTSVKVFWCFKIKPPDPVSLESGGSFA